jgi:hypothetical protein
MTTSMRVLVVQPISHTLPLMYLQTTTTTTRPQTCILALHASAHSAPCNVLPLPKNLLSARSLATPVILGRLCIFLVPKRFLGYLVALQLGSVFWYASHLILNAVACIDRLGLQHDKSILHLDLKPGNVLLTWDEGALMYAYIHPQLSSSLMTCQPTRDAL